MEEPREELKADADERAEAPDFEALTPPDELVRGDRTRDDFFDAVLALDSPATANDVAEIAGHGVDAAREYLDWFERMGIVTQVTESPATYERNQEYLNWRRVQKLRQEYATEELLDLLKTESERVEELESEFAVESPDEISIAGYANETDRSIEDVWDRLSAWQTARRRVALLERALTTESSDGADLQSAV
jgi:predicted ArsR family transcriptional regulator